MRTIRLLIGLFVPGLFFPTYVRTVMEPGEPTIKASNVQRMYKIAKAHCFGEAYEGKTSTWIVLHKGKHYDNPSEINVLIARLQNRGFRASKGVSLESRTVVSISW